MTYDTVLYAGVEKSFSDLGISRDSVVGERTAGLNNDTLQFEVTSANITDSYLFAFEGIITVYASRVSTDGSPNSFSGGVCKFQGKQITAPSMASPGKNGMVYRFEGPSYDLSHTQFLQPYKGISGNFNNGKLVLFTSTQNAGGFFYIPISVGDQIQAALQFVLDRYAAQGMAAPFQYKGRALHAGVIDLTRTGGLGGFVYTYLVPTDGSATIDPALFNLYLPSYEVKSLMCSEVVNKALELSPRTNVGFDYSTTPPTILVKSIDNLPAASLPIYDGTNHRSVDITPRPDLVARAVTIIYEIRNTVDGQALYDYAQDKWGPHGFKSALDPSDGLRVLCETINLQGYSETTQTGHLDTEPLGATSAQNGTSGGTSADTAAKRAWWSSRRGGEQSELRDSRARFQTLTYTPATSGGLTTSTITGATAAAFPDATFTYANNGFDITGTPVTAGQALTSADRAFYVYRLVRGAAHSWMSTPSGAAVKTLKVRCTVSAKYVMWDKLATADAGAGNDQLPANEATSDGQFNGNPVENYQAGKDLHANLELTNGASGTYEIVSSVSPGEAYLLGAGGIAQYLFNALNVLQYEGEYVKVSADFDAGVSVVNSMNFTGGRPEWATMNAQVQSVRERWGDHETEVRIGLSRHLAAAQLSSMLNMFRQRYPWFNPAIQADNGLGGTGGSVDMAVTAGNANSTQGVKAPSSQSLVVYNTVNDPTSGIKNSIQNDAGQISDTGINIVPTKQPNGTWTMASGPLGTGSGTLNYRDLYNSANSYNTNDMVVVRSGTSQGVYVCLQNGVTSSNPPTWPEPGGTVYWRLLNLGVITLSVCSGGSSKSQDFNANAPY